MKYLQVVCNCNVDWNDGFGPKKDDLCTVIRTRIFNGHGYYQLKEWDRFEGVRVWFIQNYFDILVDDIDGQLRNELNSLGIKTQ